MKTKLSFSEINFIYLSNINKLSNHQRNIALCLCKGMRTSEIAKMLNVKSNTISTIKKIIFWKLEVKNQIELYKNYHNLLLKN